MVGVAPRGNRELKRDFTPHANVPASRDSPLEGSWRTIYQVRMEEGTIKMISGHRFEVIET
jgi:hypothetical protein